MSERASWSVEVIPGCPDGSRVCLGCGALVLDDEAAVDTHRLYHELTTLHPGTVTGP